LFTSKWAGNTKFAIGNGNNRLVQDLNGRKIHKNGGMPEFAQTISAVEFESLMLFGTVNATNATQDASSNGHLTSSFFAIAVSLLFTLALY